MKCPPFGVMVEYASVKAAPAAGRDVWAQAKAAPPCTTSSGNTVVLVEAVS